MHLLELQDNFFRGGASNFTKDTVSCPIETWIAQSIDPEITHFSYPRNVTPRFTANIRTRFIASRTNTNTTIFAEINREFPNAAAQYRIENSVIEQLSSHWGVRLFPTY